MKIAKCLVTGGCGFIGGHVVEALLDAGHEVTVIDNLSSGRFRPSCEVITEDILTYNIKEKYDYVFHLAALPSVQGSIDDPVVSHNANLTGTLCILEYCRRTGAKIIFSSSSAIYEGDILPTKEQHKKNPRSPYAIQKQMSEQYIRLYSELYGIDYVNLRYFNVYGERASTEGSYPLVISLFLKQKTEGKPLTITNTGEQKRDFTYVKDVAQANLLAMRWGNGDYNIGAGSNYSVNEVAQMIGGDTVNVGERKGEPFATLADNSRAIKAGWKQSIALDEWIESLV